MADITITPANVLKSSSGRIIQGIAGEALTQGQPVYLKAADSKYWRAVNTTAAEALVVGIVANACAANQPVTLIGDDTALAIGATVAAGVAYYVSGNAGGICPVGDITSTDFVTIVGIGVTTGALKLLNAASGVALA